MFEMFKKPDEEHNNGELNTAEPCENTENDYLSTLQALNGEEKALLAEKTQLVNLEQEAQDREPKERDSRTEAKMRSPSKSAKHTSPEIGNQFSSFLYT